jgi:hypothetical protein
MTDINEEKEKTDNKVKPSRETATENYNQWAKAWRVGRKMRHASGEDQEEFDRKKQEIIDFIEDSFLEYNHTENNLTYVFQFPEKSGDIQTIKINKPTGEALSSGDQFKENQHVKKAQAFLERMTGKPPVFFSKLDFVDLEALYTIMNHFLGS